MKPCLFLLLLSGAPSFGADTRESLPSLVQQAQRAEQQDRLDEAVTLYKRILRIRPGWASAELNLGLVYHSRGEHALAIQILSEALRHQPELHSALLFRGSSYAQLARAADAVRDLKEYLRHQPEDADALPILAEALLAQGEPAEAAVAYATLARVTRDASAWFRLSDCYARVAGKVAQQLPEEQANRFRQALTAERAPACGIDGDAELTSVRCSAEEGDFETASRTLTAVLRRPLRTSDGASRLADTLSGLSQLAVAKVLSIAPESGWAALLRAQAAEQLGQTEVAEKEYQKAVRVAGAISEMYLRYGQFQCRHGQLDAGLASYEQALRIDKSAPGVMGLIGEVHLLQNRPERAIEYLQKAVEAKPLEVQSRLYLAQALTQTGQTAQAVRVLEAAPEDRDGRIHYVLGRTYMQQGEPEKARKAMEIFRQRRGSVNP